jgi:hypothetical protein
LTTTTAAASPAAADSYRFQTRLESNNLRDMLTPTGINATALSFWARSSLTGTFSGSVLVGSATNRSYIFTYVITAANTWQKFTISIPSDAGTTNVSQFGTGTGAIVAFDIGAGTNSEAAAGAWVSGSFFRAPSSVRLISTLSATLDITGVQFEIGLLATLFEYRPFEMEVLMCQRYYEKTYDLDQPVPSNTGSGTVYVPMAAATTTVVQYGTVQYKVLKRSTPNMTGYTDSGTSGTWTVRDNGTLIGTGSAQWDQISPTNSRIRVTSLTGTVTVSSSSNWYIAFGHWVADARL